MRAGVCCHRGTSEPSASYDGAWDGVVVENAHAEVRTTVWREDWAGRNVHVAVDRSDWRGLLDAIEAFGEGSFAGVGRGRAGI